MTIINAEIGNPKLVEKFTDFLCHELDIRPLKVTIASYEPDDGTLGLCIDESEDEFILLVKEKGRDIGCVFNTIAHEMIHVKQFLKENLNHWIHTCWETPYHERWWEVEAYSESVPLVEKFAKTLKKV
jgi:hypothetical protein